ncbi:MAG: SDR family oxidoreductase [Ardenticatenaceae bacterium]
MERPKVVLITGASSGIGKATAIEMRGRGWRVFATVRRQNDMVTLAKLGRGLIEALIMDVTNEESIARAMGIIRERAGRLDALVNNAGIVVPGPVELLSADELRHQFEVNVIGLHSVTRAALPMLRESGGRIVNISSVAGEEVFPFNGAYAASKHALEALSDALRMELHGIVKVIVLQPGAVMTPIWQKALHAKIPTNEHYPPEEAKRISQLFWKVGQGGLESKKVAQAVGNALELPWPLARLIVIKGFRLPVYLMRILPLFLRDRIKRRALGWPPKN